MSDQSLAIALNAMFAPTSIYVKHAKKRVFMISTLSPELNPPIVLHQCLERVFIPESHVMGVESNQSEVIGTSAAFVRITISVKSVRQRISMVIIP
jgi:hypothetical protein